VNEKARFPSKSFLNFASVAMNVATLPRWTRIVAALLTGWFLFSCSPTRRLHENQYLLVKNNVIEKSKLKKSERDNISSYVQQKPNRKMLGFYRFYLQTYNLPNPDKLARKKEKQLARLEAKNKKIEEYNSTVTRSKKKKKLKKERLLFGEWLQKIGEPPVILDSFKIEKSVTQLTRYAQNKGFFQATVYDSVTYKKKKATVHYIVNRGPAYYVDTIKYEIADTVIAGIVGNLRRRPNLKEGMKYDLDKFDEERERITQILRNRGFYLFQKEFIRYKADTVAGSQQVALTMVIDQPDLRYVQGKDTIPVKQHKQFLIRHIYVITDYQLQAEQYYPDTVYYANYRFLYNGKLRYNPKILSQSVFFDHNQFFQLRNEEKTQRSLAELRNFKYVHIRYEPELSDKQYDILDVYIELSPTPKQNVGVELQGTNTEGNLGVSIGASYQNKNIFKGTEVLEFRITAGAEIQVLQGDSAFVDTTDFGLGPFNTIEVGGQLSLVTSRFLFPIKINRIKKWAKPKTRITLALNYQNRPDYARLVGSLLFGYEWTQTNMRSTYIIRHIVNPIEVSVIRIFPKPNFQDFIDNIDDQFVRNSFKDHFILGASYTFVFNNQSIRNPLKDFFFFRSNAQIGGNFLSLVSLIGKDQPVNGSHTVFGIQYAQYVRMDLDLRFYAKFTLSHSLATRAYIGVGLPYGNSTVLPFEKSFYAGGANDLRAWLPRTLGPGSFAGFDSGRVDQVGDIKLLANVEYRFTVYKFLEGALFADFGNIWLIRPDPDRPNGDFQFSRFWNELALGAGVGVRLNFNFFIFRLDVALPFRDPTKPSGQRWVIQNLKGDQVRVNIGIGYPF